MVFANLHFLQALGHALLSSLWQYACIWLLYVLLSTVAGRRAERKYYFAVVLQLVGFAWFLYTFLCSFFNVNSFFQIADFKQFVTFPSNTLLSFVAANSTVLFTGISLVYLGFLVAASAWWLKTYRQTLGIRQKGIQKIQVDWRLYVQKVSAQIGIKKRVDIFISSLVETPLTIGYLKPVILIPVGFLNNLTCKQVEAVLLHELAHIKRFDYLINLVMTAVETILYFNPFVRFFGKEIREKREHCCDNYVLQFGHNPAIYSAALLKLAVVNHRQNALALGAASNNKQLLSRVRRMIETKECDTWKVSQQLLALVVFLCLIVIATTSSPVSMVTTKVVHAAFSQTLPSAPVTDFSFQTEVNRQPLHRPTEEQVAVSEVRYTLGFRQVKKSCPKIERTALAAINPVDNHEVRAVSFDERQERVVSIANADASDETITIDANQLAEIKTLTTKIEVARKHLEAFTFQVPDTLVVTTEVLPPASNMPVIVNVDQQYLDHLTGTLQAEYKKLQQAYMLSVTTSVKAKMKFEEKAAAQEKIKSEAGDKAEISSSKNRSTKTMRLKSAHI